MLYLGSIVLNCAQLCSIVPNWAQPGSTELKCCSTGHFREYEEHEHEQKPLLEAHRFASAKKLTEINRLTEIDLG